MRTFGKRLATNPPISIQIVTGSDLVPGLYRGPSGLQNWKSSWKCQQFRCFDGFFTVVRNLPGFLLHADSMNFHTNLIFLQWYVISQRFWQARSPWKFRYNNEKFWVDNDASAVTSDGKGCGKGKILGRRRAKLQRMLVLSHPCRTKYDA